MFNNDMRISLGCLVPFGFSDSYFLLIATNINKAGEAATCPGTFFSGAPYKATNCSSVRNASARVTVLVKVLIIFPLPAVS